jgi:hypothetical protein
MADLRQLLSYTVGDPDYQNFGLKTIIGEQFDTEDALEKLKRNPVDSGIPFPAVQMLPPDPDSAPVPDGKSDPDPLVKVSQDPEFHSFAYGADARGFLVNVVTQELGQMSYDTTLSLVALPRNAGSFWSVLAKNIRVLDKQGGYGLTNPQGFVGMNGRLLTANRDDTRIFTIEKNEMNGLKDGTDYQLKNDSFDVGITAGLPSDARGQALFPAKEGAQSYLNALFNRPTDPRYDTYDSSIVVRLPVDPDTGALSYKDQYLTAPNAQGFSLMKNNAGVTRLAVHHIGGKQFSGETNGILSCIASLPAFGAPWNTDAYKIHLTGDPAGGSGSVPVVFDIRTVDIAYRGRPDDIVVIFTGIYTNGYANFSYAVFFTTAAKLLSLNAMTISEAAASGAITYAFGETDAPGKDLWDICIAMGKTSEEDVLWFRGGSEIHARLVKDLGKPDAREIVYYKGLGPCKIGGDSINVIDVTSETVRQSEEGMPKKRTLRGAPPNRNTNPGNDK